MDSGMRMPPFSTFSACPTGTRLPRRMPFRSQTTAWMLSTPSALISQLASSFGVMVPFRIT
jgi:hypothetical protein